MSRHLTRQMPGLLRVAASSNHSYEFSDIAAFAKTYFKPECEKFISKNSRIVTIGSCFAVNVARHLSRKGYDAWSLDIGELINNSYNNLWLIRNMGEISKKENSFWAKLQPGLYNNCLQLEEKIRNCDCLIFTLGLSLAFIQASGEVISEPIYSWNKSHYPGVELVEIDVAQNVENINAILDIIHEINPSIKVVISLSPVPLDGILDSNQSVIELDCVSKSIGRVTLSKLKKVRPAFVYFPSYELVRWVGCNQPFPLYGGDENDQSTRHVTSRVIEKIMTVFEDFYLL